jgi:hypothetical protein
MPPTRAQAGLTDYLGSIKRPERSTREAGVAVCSTLVRGRSHRRQPPRVGHAPTKRTAEAGAVSRSQNASGPLAQLLKLMGQDARQQPRAWYDDQAQLSKKREGVQLEPVLRDPSLDEAVELKAGE